MSDNLVQKKIFESRRDWVTGDRRRLHTCTGGTRKQGAEEDCIRV
jgi:hypothetical protein